LFWLFILFSFLINMDKRGNGKNEFTNTTYQTIRQIGSFFCSSLIQRGQRHGQRLATYYVQLIILPSLTYVFENDLSGPAVVTGNILLFPFRAVQLFTNKYWKVFPKSFCMWCNDLRFRIPSTQWFENSWTELQNSFIFHKIPQISSFTGLQKSNSE
jgi:hypothetical protein